MATELRDAPYCPREAVQVKLGNRWRNGEVAAIRLRAGFFEVIVQYQDQGATIRLLMDAASPCLRKWGAGKLAKERKPMKGYKPAPRYRRGRRV